MPSVSREVITLPQLRELVGSNVGQSDWKSIPQERIDGFAELTEDRQFIHVDPVRARTGSPFGGTIAHGFLSLSLLSAFAEEALPALQGTAMGLNYGFDKIRFLHVVPSGARVRARFVLGDVGPEDSARVRVRYEVTIEIEGVERPALVADWLVMYALQ